MTRLTPTERRVAELAAIGRRNDEVAAELGMARKTVETHLTRVYRKLGVRSRTELAALDAGVFPRPNGSLRELSLATTTRNEVTNDVRGGGE